MPNDILIAQIGNTVLVQFRKSEHCGRHRSQEQTPHQLEGVLRAAGTLSPPGAWHTGQRDTGATPPWTCLSVAGSRRDRGCRSGWCQSRSRQPPSSSSDTCTQGSPCHAWDTPVGRAVGMYQSIIVHYSTRNVIIAYYLQSTSPHVSTGRAHKLCWVIVITSGKLFSTVGFTTVVSLCGSRRCKWK